MNYKYQNPLRLSACSFQPTTTVLWQLVFLSSVKLLGCKCRQLTLTVGVLHGPCDLMSADAFLSRLLMYKIHFFFSFWKTKLHLFKAVVSFFFSF